MDPNKVSRRLKEVRGEAGLTQSAFAERLGLPYRTYQVYEGGREIPIGVLGSLYESFGINPAWMVLGDIAPRRGTAFDIGLITKVLSGLLDRWSRLPNGLSAEEKIDDFLRVYRFF